MPDYTSILRRSISALPDAAPAMREAVYQRARAALARQLTAVDPPLSTREIEAQHQQLESAVALIEAEFGDDTEFGDMLAPAPVISPPREELRRRAEPSIDKRRDRDDDFDPDTGADGGEAYDPDEDYDDGSSRAPLLIICAVLLLLLIGGGALVYAQRDLVAAWTGLPIGEQQVAATSPAEAPASIAPTTPPVQPAQGDPEPLPSAPEPGASADGPQKRPDRLINGEPAPALPAEPEDETAPPASIQGPLPGAEQAEAPPGIAPDPAAPPPPEAQPGTPVPPPAGQSIVAQRAIFYEQGTEGAPGQAWQGTVAWSQVQRPDGSQGIQAVLELPDQNVTTTISISRNSDETLPASHLVEIEFSGSGSLGPAAVERVPALVLKPNEQARGQPLSGAAVPVTERLFWIALSSEDEQIDRNLALLREGSWFDLPILFVGGQRALITFEKGIPGDKVFETVLAGWTPSP